MHTFIIAEAGVNHNGDIGYAKRLIDMAVQAGCDAVKFQTFKAERLVSRFAEKAEYQTKNTGKIESQFDMLKELELKDEDHIVLMNYAHENGIIFMSTPFDEQSADLLDELGMEIFKIPSGEVTNKPFLKHIAKKNKPIVLSTGMSTLDEIEEAIGWIFEQSNNNITLLHCTTSYPTQMEDVNLRAMHTLCQAFKVDVGYSDHTVGVEVPIAAVAMGAKVIEKHITLDKNMPGPDHKASLEADELLHMVTAIRNIEKAMGDGIKKATPAEESLRNIVRKSIIANNNIQKNAIITRGMLCIKRPGTGLAPKHIDEVIGKKANRDIPIDTPITFNDF